jgi:hypothetical protein
MKINRFNESLKSNWKPTDKVLKVSIVDFEVSIDEIEKTNRYQQEFNRICDMGGDIMRARKSAIYYGIEEWIYTDGNLSMKYELVDGNDNPIKDEKAFDDYVKNIGKYNV